MPTDADFLRAIIADPDADGPRLVYADWLEECGAAARAEFIRVQCALAAMPPGEATHHALAARQAELESAHRTDWLQPIREVLRASATNDSRGWRRWLRLPQSEDLFAAEFRRGFVEILRLNLSAFLGHAARLTRMTPLRDLILESADESASAGAWESLAQCPDLAGLTALAVSTHRLSAREMQFFVENGLLANLKSLGLINPGFDRQAVEVLISSPLLPRLTGLSLVAGGGELHEGCIDLLLSGSTCRKLETLFIGGMFDLDAAYLQRLAGLPPFGLLTQLQIINSPVGDIDLSDFVDWLPPTMSDLQLSSLELGDRAAVSLANSPRLRSLCKLDLQDNRISDVGAMALADSPNLLASTHLNLRHNPIGPRVRNALRIRLGHHVLV